VALFRQVRRIDAAWDGLPAVQEEDFHDDPPDKFR
jgi:hypothetical protein